MSLKLRGFHSAQASSNRGLSIMYQAESWLGKHIITAFISLSISGLMAFSAIAWGFTQSTIENETALKQHVSLLDNTVKQYISANEKTLQVIREDTKWLKENLHKVIITTAVLESKE